MEAEIKIVSSCRAVRVVRASRGQRDEVLNSKLCHHGREGMAKETYAYFATLLAHQADRLSYGNPDAFLCRIS